MSNIPKREIPLRDLFLTIGDYFRAGLRHWWVLMIGGLIFGLYQGYTARKQATAYAAPLTFVLNEDQGGNRMGGLLGQFGLGGGSSSGASPEKIIALAKSQKLLHSLLLDTVAVKGQTDRLANHLIKAYNLVETLELPENRRSIVHQDIELMSEEEKGLLKMMYGFVLDETKQILQVSNNDDTGILTINATTVSQPISLAISYGLYEKLSKFYTEESTGNSRATVARLRVKADSVATALNAAEYRLAGMMDTRLGALQRRDLVRQAQLDRQVQLLNLTYAEVLRNLETASFALSTKTPFFQTVDVPFTPLFPKRANWKKKLLSGGAIGAFLGFLLVGAVKFYRDVMADK